MTTAIWPFQSGPAPFGYKQDGWHAWKEDAQEQMIIGYIASSHAAGESLRRISTAVESVYGKKISHAGIVKILKRRQELQANPPKPCTIHSYGDDVEVDACDLSTVPEKSVDKIKLDDVFFNVENLIQNSVMELGQEQVETLRLRIAMGLERITDNLNCWDDSLPILIEGTYQHALARKAYLNEQASTVVSTQAREFKPGDVVEFDASKWTQCDDCGLKFTHDPKAAGWHHQYGDVWACQSCEQWHYSYAHQSAGGREIHFSIGNHGTKYKKKFTMPSIRKLLKVLEKDSKANAPEIKMWKDYLKKIDTQYACLSSHVDEKYFEIIKRHLGFDPATLPPIPETIKL